MTAGPAPSTTDDDQPLERLALAGTNINEQTYLATDYLNHFNELVMFLEMIPSMPDMLADAKQWAPKPYAEHFRYSTFKDRDLAVRAYEVAPRRYREMFDQTVERMNNLVHDGLVRLDEVVADGNADRIDHEVKHLSRALQKSMDLCSGIIHGNVNRMSQEQIDSLLS